MAIKRKTYKNKKSSRKYKKTSVKHKKNRKTYRKKKGGFSDPPRNLEPLQEPETPDAPNFEPHTPEGPPPGFEPQTPPDWNWQPREEAGTPNDSALVQNIEDLIVGNSYQVVHYYEEYENHRTNRYRDNNIATLLRIDGRQLYFENITPNGDDEEGMDYYTWDNNRNLRIYNIGFPFEAPLFRGGKRNKK